MYVFLPGTYKLKELGLTSTASGSGRNPDFDTSFHTSNDDNQVTVHAIKDGKSPLQEQDMPDHSLRYNWHLRYKIRCLYMSINIAGEIYMKYFA